MRGEVGAIGEEGPAGLNGTEGPPGPEVGIDTKWLRSLRYFPGFNTFIFITLLLQFILSFV